jgi:succinoglycan biosynthesis transport protein ExoP
MLNDLSRRTVAHIVFKRRLLCSLAFFAPVAVFCLLVLPRPSEYESFASLMVKVADPEAAAPELVSEQQSRSVGSAASLAKQIIASQQVIITSEVVKRSALERIGIERVYPELPAQASRKRGTLLDQAAERLARDITVQVGADTNILQLSAFNRDPQVAQALLTSLIRATFDRHVQVMRDPRMDFLESKLAALREQSQRAEQALLEFKQATKISSFEDERALLLKQRDAVELDLSQLKTELVSAEGRGVALARSLADTPRDVAITNENDLNQRAFEDAQQKLTAAVARLDAARRRLAPGNPELADFEASVGVAERAVAELRQQSSARIRSGANPVSQEISSSLFAAGSSASANRRGAQEREQQLQALNLRLAYLDQNEAGLRELERRRELADVDYRSYMERAQSARIVTDMNEAGITNLSIVQPPTLPYQPARPRKLLLGMLAVLAGLFAAAAALFLVEQFDDTLSAPAQVEPATGLPLLLVIEAKRISDHA